MILRPRQSVTRGSKNQILPTLTERQNPCPSSPFLLVWNELKVGSD